VSRCIGVDFDNTIVRYDEVFHQVAAEQGLIPVSAPVSKGSVRDTLRAAGREDDWTRMQGEVYGKRMPDAAPFPGALGFFRRAVRRGVRVCIVSHKTRYPYLGPRYDLHGSAWVWLERNGFFSPAGIGMPRDLVFLEERKEDKLRRIGSAGCTHFIDDLPELLAEPGFPPHTERFLFDPGGVHTDATAFRRVTSWHQLMRELLPE